MDIDKEIDYWFETAQNDLQGFPSGEKGERVRNLFKSIESLRYYFLEDKKGLIVYCIHYDFRGELTLSELFMYIKQEYRGNIRLFKELIRHIEQTAKENNCKTVRIGANLKYKDEKILRALMALGYKTDAVVKYME